MAEFPALPFWTDAYLGDTGHLSCLESGAYLHLIFACWRSPDCSLPDDNLRLQRFSRCTPREWKKVRVAVMAFFILADGKWTQKRLLREREWVRANSKRQAHAANSKWLKSKESTNATASPRHMPNASHSDAPIPRPISIEEKRDLKSITEDLAKKKKMPSVENSVDYTDKSQRKARWQQKIIAEINLTLPSEKAVGLITAYQRGENWAVQRFEEFDDKIRRRGAN